MKKVFSKEFIIGLSVIVAIAVLVFGINFLKGVNLLNPANYYYAEYENVSGLDVAAPVKIDGYKVGQVRAIEFDYAHPGKIKVMLALNKDLKVPADSKVSLGSTLMGGSFVVLDLGESGTPLEVGSTIVSVREHDLMGKVKDEVLPAVSAIIPKVDSLLVNLNRLTGDPALTASVQRLDGITAQLLATTTGLNGTVNRDLPVVMRNARSITHGLDTVTANLGALSYQLKSLPLNATMNNVEVLTQNLTRFSEQLNNQNSTLGLLTSDPELYHRLNRVGADVDSLILDIKRNPKRYINIKVF